MQQNALEFQTIKDDSTLFSVGIHSKIIWCMITRKPNVAVKIPIFLVLHYAVAVNILSYSLCNFIKGL